MRFISAITMALTLAICLESGVAYGHALDQGYVYLRVGKSTLDGRVELTMQDLNSTLGLSLPTDQSVTRDDLEPHIETIREYVTERVSLAINGGPGAMPLTDYDLMSLSFAQYLQLNFSFPDLAEEPQKIDIEYTAVFDENPDHRGMLVIETNWKTGTFNNEANVSLVFEPGRERQTLDLSSTSTLSGFNAMVRMGTHHIWIGIDHILFLIALLLPSVVHRQNRTWQSVTEFHVALIHVIKIVTIFTIAHTITLSLAALQTISLPSRLVESVIAISIAIAALDIVVPIFKQRIWWIVFAFGLFHGFGFASVLAEIGIPPAYMVHSLLGFNLGVELGQVAIVLAVFPILYFLRQQKAYVKAVLPGAAAILIAVSLYWFTERAFLIDLPAGAIVNKLLALSS